MTNEQIIWQLDMVRNYLQDGHPDSVENWVAALEAVIDQLKTEKTGMGIDTIKEILREQKMSQTSLAEKMGITRQAINQELNRNTSIKYDKFRSMADALGYEVVVRAKQE